MKSLFFKNAKKLRGYLGRFSKLVALHFLNNIALLPPKMSETVCFGPSTYIFAMLVTREPPTGICNSIVEKNFGNSISIRPRVQKGGKRVWAYPFGGYCIC